MRTGRVPPPKVVRPAHVTGEAPAKKAPTDAFGGAPAQPIQSGGAFVTFTQSFTRDVAKALEVPPPPAPLAPPAANVLPDGHPLLRPTWQLEGREALRAQLVDQLVQAGRVRGEGETRTAFVLAGPMGTGKLNVLARLQAGGALPSEGVVRADADFIHPLIPEQQQLAALGDARANSVVHGEAAGIAIEALRRATEEGREILWNSMLSTDERVAELTKLRERGYRTVVVAVVAPIEKSIERAGANGRYVPMRGLLESHQGFASRFEQIRQAADAVVLIDFDEKPEVIAVSSNGVLEVHAPAAFARFQESRSIDPTTVPPDAVQSP